MSLFHYCKNENLINIISSRELWLSDLSLSNDSMEGRWVRHVFVEVCKEQQISDWDIEKLLNQLEITLNFFRANGFCLTQEGDALSQWRGYADGGAGVSIGFNQAYLQALGEQSNEKPGLQIKLNQVAYDKDEQAVLLKDAIDRVLKHFNLGALNLVTVLASSEEEVANKRQFMSMGFAFVFFAPLLFRVKNPAFAEEKEWRLVTQTTQFIGKSDSQLAHTEFRATQDRIIPFVRLPLLDLGIPPIDKIILGPRNITPENVVEGALNRYGFDGVVVERSKATYR
ncbi:MAG TPA: DUF2971 domain-containing protein [Alphaproteobacteria bacterium]|jgi:hypothetical protein